uniref:GINS subunit domain-containing protein n=1 Tax=Hyaloperonospora arabidopsidis (strain Emoy2) TaxID=559515 RepID=M4BXF7_HYAAE
MSSLPEFNPENLNEDVVRMRTLWVNELHAPEILQYSDEMVSEMLEQIRNQQEYIDSINEDRDQLTEQKSLVNKLYQMEIDRLRYMVSSYLRTRLRKIEKFAFHILEDAELMQRLSVKERSFAQQFMMLYESHVNDLALSKLDEESRSLSAEGMAAMNDSDGCLNVRTSAQAEFGRLRVLSRQGRRRCAVRRQGSKFCPSRFV